jgi:glycosyltransferase involved in cell wall biosynthesis
MSSNATKVRLRIALAHDYITQRGGAERVAVLMAEAFPRAPMYTTLYEPRTSFDDFTTLDIRTSVLNRLPLLRRDHRLALPALAPVVSRMTVDADVLLASSSGWAHGIGCTGRKIIYCHAPARWLYQRDRYLGASEGLPWRQRALRSLAAGSVGALETSLRVWDKRGATGADRYLVNSTVIQKAVLDAYGIEAEVLPPPPAMDQAGPVQPFVGLDRPFVLCVARLLPYKNVDQVIEAFKAFNELDLVVVGKGPDEQRLMGLAAGNRRIHLLGQVADSQLRWLYAECIGLVAASYEDFGLSPLEAAVFGKPTVALRSGGYLDTIDESVNGVFFDAPVPKEIRQAVVVALERRWSSNAIQAHAARFGKQRFIERLRAVVAEELR